MTGKTEEKGQEGFGAPGYKGKKGILDCLIIQTLGGEMLAGTPSVWQGKTARE